MWFRFLLISFLKFIATMAAIVMLVKMLPDATPSAVIIIVSWALALIFAFLFASWAFGTRLPIRKDVLSLVTIWSLVYVTGFLMYGILLSVRGPRVLISMEILVQLALEIGAILFAAYSIRRRRFAAVLGEGMTV
ncbi:hypothetical protein KJ781_02020 [Patescibacteria group bacterium]|nr:hypothetical protein [Patescibacteria group bacterium]MBU1448412.1 hypothetical protein [Patescibacteria group bacterium]MBU2613377.1 hypothetical protein [Patescibacteria group bacterium]